MKYTSGLLDGDGVGEVELSSRSVTEVPAEINNVEPILTNRTVLLIIILID